MVYPPPEFWPVVVMQDRYCGVYSEGQWLAIRECSPTRFASLDDGPLSDDVSAAEFWIKPPHWIVAADTPEEAIAFLLAAPVPEEPS